MSGELCDIVVIGNQRGLHARAAAKFVRVVEGFQADIMVTKESISVSGRSIMGLMMLAAGPGSKISIKATGKDAKAAPAKDAKPAAKK